MKKKLLWTSIACTLPLTMSLCACNKSQNDPEINEINVDLLSDRLAFSNTNLSSDAGAQYTINVNGTTKNGDYAIILISQQMCGDDPVSYIKLSEDSVCHELQKGTTRLTVKLLPTGVKTDFFKVTFSLEVRVFRVDKTVYKCNLNDLIYFNGTATPLNLFNATQTKTTLDILSLKNDPYAQEQLILCDVFALPSGTTSIANNAFYNPNTPFPSNTQRVYLDKSELDPLYQSLLTEIGENAFRANTFNGPIIIPSSTKHIKHHAFYECKGVTKIIIPKDVALDDYCFANLEGEMALDLSVFNQLPTNWGNHIFDKTDPENMTCYHNSAISADQWKEFMASHEIDADGWTFVAKN